MKINPKIKNILEWGYCIVIALGLAILFRSFIGTPTVVKQQSMYDTLKPNERLFLNRWINTVNGEYKRGDIITFEAPSFDKSQRRIPTVYEIDNENPVAEYEYEPQGIISKFFYYVLETSKTSYIKRIIGVAGDHIKIEDGKVYLNGKELDEPYLNEGVETIAENYSDIVVPEGYVFAMGDNRTHSTDCRSFGCVPIEKIASKVWIRFWPLNRFGKVN